jgi:hypothetical protein
MRKLLVMTAAVTLCVACQSPPQPVERPKRTPTPGQANLPPTPNLNPPQAPDRYPDGAWSVRGLLAADKKALTVLDPVTQAPASLQLRGNIASLHPCALTEKVCRPAPYLELSDNKTGQGRRILVGGERDLDARHFTVGTEVTISGRFATSSADGTYFAPDGLILLDPLPPPPDADATTAKPAAK